LLETDGDGNTQVTYTQTPDIYGQIVSQRRDSTTTFYHHDALGSTLALTDGSEAITDTYRFYAFGETLTSSGTTTNPFQYVGNLGYYNEAALALQYLRARYYQPQTGRFVSADPIFSVNLYTYAQNAPLTRFDPSGLWSAWSVHRNWTAKLARHTYIGPVPVLYTFPHWATRIIGQSCGGVDVAYSTMDPSNWHIHFNFEFTPANLKLWARGDPTPGWNTPADTRNQWYDKWFGRAVTSAIMGFCEAAYREFGTGLHAVQDIYAHMDLTAAEHMDKANVRYVDNTRYERSANYSYKRYLQAKEPYYSFLAGVFGGYPLVRVFRWPASRQRIEKTRARTCKELERFLDKIKTTTCVSKRPAKPCQRPPKPPTRCTSVALP